MGYLWTPPATDEYGQKFITLLPYNNAARTKYNLGNDCFLAKFEGNEDMCYSWRHPEILNHFTPVAKLD